MNRIIEHLRAYPVLAILRGVPAEHVVALGRALLLGGVRSLEVAFTDADASDKITALVAALGDASGDASGGAPRVVVGAGTVTTPERAAAAQAAGATFVVTPHVAPRVNAFAREHALPVLCGATTPSEIAQAREQGAAFVKLFPAGPLGPAYLRALLGPYPDLEVFAVGGIGASNAAAFLEAGAIGLGVGGALTSRDWTAPDFDTVAALARQLVDVAATAREAQR